ncbi:hypothetical protein PISMIDRAFT_672547 [Pisolithus microcarpus 441]|uniref:Uncharacterized protein n=1 Tax=Pisolithus microcarpus 441 TaxID=765257 RepID=A0A0C9ZT07_9AGAM|nr:hypothetical protein PISMIDRAFT_672547 [Pisolithus microcarpus 441]
MTGWKPSITFSFTNCMGQSTVRVHRAPVLSRILVSLDQLVRCGNSSPWIFH